MHILIVEDEVKTAAYLKKGLTEHGFIVDVTHNGEDGLFQAESVKYDLIILDIMLPKLSGLDIVQKLRKNNHLMPILFLTARDEIQDRVKGLELGADDYLVKPFAFSELLARVHSLMRRGQQQTSKRLTFADLEIDLLSHKARRNQRRLDLSPKEFALLSLFCRHQGEILSRTFIAEQVWDMNFDSQTNVVDVAVRRLRKKVDDGYTPKLIHTVRSVGYVFEER